MKEANEIPQDTELLSSVIQLEEFKGSTVWTDLKRVLEDRIQICLRGLERAETLEQVRYYQAVIENTRGLLVLPDMLIQEQNEKRNGRRPAGYAE